MNRIARITIHNLRLDRSVLSTRMIKPLLQNLNFHNNNNRSRTLKSGIVGLNIRPIGRLRNFNQILKALRRNRAKAAVNTNLNTVTRPIARLNSLPLADADTANKVSRRQNFPDNNRNTSRLAKLSKIVGQYVPAQINRNNLIISRLLMSVNRNLKTLNLNISGPKITISLMPQAKDANLTKRRRRNLVELRNRSMLTLNDNLLNNLSRLIDNLQRNSTRLLGFDNIMRMDRQTNILQRAMNLTTRLRRYRQTKDRVILMLNNLVNSVLRGTLNRSLEGLNMASLDRVQHVTDLSINLRLLSRFKNVTVRLNNLSLGIQILLIPLNRGIISRNRTFKVKRAIRVNSISRATVTTKLHITDDITTTTANRAGARYYCHNGDDRSTLIIQCRVSAPSVVTSSLLYSSYWSI